MGIVNTPRKWHKVWPGISNTDWYERTKNRAEGYLGAEVKKTGEVRGQ